jgi:acyl-CoA dehydrogenase
MDALEHLLRAPARAADTTPSLHVWLERLDACPFTLGIDRALWAGFEADRLGYAFVGGYHAALQKLLESRNVLSASKRLSLAATEAGGAHPRAITTVLAVGDTTNGKQDLVLRGEKTFATLASVADELLVVATRGIDATGRNDLCLVRVRRDAPGLTIEDRPAMPFAPEIPRARLKLDHVSVAHDDVLPGDGYADYLKPFRTIEDAHVLAASIGHILRTARAWSFDGAVVEAACALAFALREVATLRPDDPTGHIALAGLFAGARRLVADHDAEWDKVDVELRDRWRRDLGLLMVAETARQARTAVAWKALLAPPSG